jgi:hypothetical protein
MSTAVALQELEEVREPSISELPGEAGWQEWPGERAPAKPGGSLALKALKWTAIAGLLALGGLWSRVTPLEVAGRFIVEAVAIVVMARSLLAARYAAVAVCGAIVLLYNPLAPLFDLSGGWQRAVLVAAAAPFLVLLIWRDGWQRLPA